MISGMENADVFHVLRGFSSIRTSLMAQMLKNLPATQETQVQSLGQEGPLEKQMATHCSILDREITCMEEPGGLKFMES